MHFDLASIRISFLDCVMMQCFKLQVQTKFEVGIRLLYPSFTLNYSSNLLFGKFLAQFSVGLYNKSSKNYFLVHLFIRRVAKKHNTYVGFVSFLKLFKGSHKDSSLKLERKFHDIHHLTTKRCQKKISLNLLQPKFCQ